MKLKMVLPLLIFLIAASAIQLAIAQPPSGMVSYWKFDEGTGTTAYDSVDGNHGTLKVKSGGTTGPPVWTTGIVDGALSFDGVDDYVDCGTNFGSISAAQKLTVEAWIKTTSTATGRLIAAQTSYGQGPWSFHTSTPPTQGQYIGIHFRDAGTKYEGSKYQINDGEWHHVVGTWDGSTNKIRLYVDGNLDTEWDSTFTMSSTARTLVIGSNVPRTTTPIWHFYFFDGVIDEVAIYDRALTPEEILQHYQNGLRGLGYYVELIVETWMTDSDFNNITSFRAVFTPYRKTGDYKLTATNPGQFYFNILVNNTGTTTRNITITYNIDPNFTTQGAMPIHVYTDINRIIDITANCTFSDNTITAYYVDPNAIIYVTIHLNYALKGTTWTKSQVNAWYSEHTFSATADAVVSTITITDPESIIPPIPSYLIFLIAILPTIILCLGIFIALLKYALLSTKRRK
ncbi:MAG: LamG domain-containing protein [Candidatus Bathyarchaeia archaeon]